MKWRKIVLSILTMTLMIIVGCSMSVFAKTTNNISLYSGDYKMLNIKTSKDVKWKIKNSKSLKYQVSDDTKSIIIIGKKCGNTKVIAKYGGNTKVWDISVKKEKDSHLSLLNINKSDEKITLMLNAKIYAGNKDLDFDYSLSYKLYRYDGSKFKKITFAADFSFDTESLMCSVKKGNVRNKKMKYVLKKEFFKNWDLEKGLYKIVCDTS